MLDFSDKRKMQFWSDFVQIKAKKSLKKWLDFSDKKSLQLWLDLLQIQSKKTLKQLLDFSDKKKGNYGQISIKFKQKNH